eukprot:6458470-Amphidinium_carterae.1
MAAREAHWSARKHAYCTSHDAKRTPDDHAFAVHCAQAQAGPATRSEVVVQQLWWCGGVCEGGGCAREVGMLLWWVAAPGCNSGGVDAMGGERPGGWVRFNNCDGVGAGGSTRMVGRARTGVGCNGLACMRGGTQSLYRER